MLIQDANTVREQSAVSEPLRESVRLPSTIQASALVDEIHQRHSAANHAKLRLYANSYLNRAYYLGYQWTRFDGGAFGLLDVENPEGELREVANRIQPNVRLLLGLLARGQSQVEPIPTTRQTRDKQFAMVARSVLDYIGRINNAERLKAESDELRVMDGTVCVRTYLDPKGGQPMQVQLPGQGPATVQFPEIRKEVYSIYHAHVFPTRLKSARDARAVLFDARRPLEELRELYPKFADQLGADEYRDLYDGMSERLDFLFSPAGAKGPQGGQQGTGRVFEYYELPCERWPQGRRVVVVNRTVVEYDVNPFVGLFPPEAPKTLQLGCVWLRGIQVPGEFYGIGFPEAARPSQNRLNRIKTDQTMNRLAMGRNRILVERGTLADPDQVTNIHGSFIEYERQLGANGAAPTILGAQALPGASQEIAETLRDIDDEFGLYDIMRGMNDAQVRSGQQFNSLLASGQQKFATLTSEREQADADDARITLALARQYYPPEKLLRIVGETKGYTLSLMAAQNLYADVDVVKGSAMPRDAAAWNGQLIELWRNGMIVDGTGRPNVKWLHQQLDLGGFRHEFADQPDIDRAQTENALFEQGRWAAPQPWDDHVCHIDEHVLWLKEHPEAGPMAQRLIMAHADMHRMMMVQAALPVGGPVPLPASQGPRPGGMMAASNQPMPMASQHQPMKGQSQ